MYEKSPEQPEFCRELVRSIDTERLWHYLPLHEADKKTPIYTPNGLPDRKSFSWDQIFPRKAPIVLEIGSGKGAFLTQYAENHPEENILGSDWEAKIAHGTALRLKRHRIQNAQVLRGDLFYFLRDRVPADSISAFHMYFPDPWPKRKHHKKRLLRPVFLDEVRRTAVSSGVLFHWATDHKEYDQWAREFFESMKYFEIFQDPAEPVDGIRTNFETKYIREGRPIYRRIYRILKE